VADRVTLGLFDADGAETRVALPPGPLRRERRQRGATTPATYLGFGPLREDVKGFTARHPDIPARLWVPPTGPRVRAAARPSIVLSDIKCVFELGDRSEYLEEHSADGGGGVDALVDDDRGLDNAAY
jgi:hypothetical protein